MGFFLTDAIDDLSKGFNRMVDKGDFSFLGDIAPIVAALFPASAPWIMAGGGLANAASGEFGIQDMINIANPFLPTKWLNAIDKVPGMQVWGKGGPSLIDNPIQGIARAMFGPDAGQLFNNPVHVTLPGMGAGSVIGGGGPDAMQAINLAASLLGGRQMAGMGSGPDKTLSALDPVNDLAKLISKKLMGADLVKSDAAAIQAAENESRSMLTTALDNVNTAFNSAAGSPQAFDTERAIMQTKFAKDIADVLMNKSLGLDSTRPMRELEFLSSGMVPLTGAFQSSYAADMLEQEAIDKYRKQQALVNSAARPQGASQMAAEIAGELRKFDAGDYNKSIFDGLSVNDSPKQSIFGSDYTRKSNMENLADEFASQLGSMRRTKKYDW